jgi:hypothetical protein
MAATTPFGLREPLPPLYPVAKCERLLESVPWWI